MTNTTTHTTPLVSIFVLSYNVKSFIRECLDSAINQNYPNLEIVIGDDCSTDGTQEILREYEIQYPHLIKLKINHANQGGPKNANATLARCMGKYFAVLDGDDMMLPGKIRAQVDFMEANPDCAICYHDVEVFYQNNEKETEISHSGKEGKLDDLLRHYLSKSVFNLAVSTFVRREYMDKFHEFLICGDLIMWVDVLEKSGGTIRHIDGVYARYRKHSGSISYSHQMMQAEILTHTYIFTRFPKYTLLGMKRCAAIYRSNRHNEYFSDFYGIFLKASLKLDFDFKTLKRLVIYYLSFKKIRR